MAASSKEPSLFVFLVLLLLLLLVSAVRGDGVQPAAAAGARHDDTAGDYGGGERVTTVRTGHGHGYSSSHSGGGTGGGGGGSAAEKGAGAGTVDPRNLNARSHRSSGAAAAKSRAALGYSAAVVRGLAGAVVLAVVALP